ncbi:MAG: type II secretion system F family protein [Planctomycetota bacterium]|nr:type II secretion system F family protein [Planctomycetota bacterium]
MIETLVVTLSALGAVVLLYVWSRQRSQRLTARERLATANLSAGLSTQTFAAPAVPEERVARWLYLADYRAPDAAARFWLQTVMLGVLGTAIAVLVTVTDALAPVRANLEEIPGRVGYVFLPVVEGLPVILVFGLAAIPTIRVRRARRKRVSQTLRDLYPVLELFASLAQAGLAFDAALARVLGAIGNDRPLGRELTTFKVEIMGGADRSRCFRRLARRLDIPQVTSFTSALIRAHEVGIGLAGTLRRQADDLRANLRERALARAQSLPSQLVFPLVLCFLPGIFVMSLGPAFYGFLVETAGFGTPR